MELWKLSINSCTTQERRSDESRFEGFAPSSTREEEINPELKFLESENPYPVRLQIENMDGEKLDIRLTGRSESNISFTREGDGRSFVYSINDLNSASRKKIRDLPALGIKGASKFLNEGRILHGFSGNIEGEVGTVDDAAKET